MKRFTVIISVIMMCVILFVVFTFSDDTELQKQTVQEATEITKELVVSDDTKETAEDTKQATANNEEVATTSEQEATDENAIETDAVVEQEDIAYNGDITGNGQALLGSYQGLTYYSQADSRWANVMYSSTGNSSQTMKSSGCGVTAGAMVVSSSKGAILPTTMASLSVDNGYRTANSGTAWAYYPFIADYFGFNEYHSTSNFNTMLSYLTQKDANGNNKYYVIASCGSGLFTSGGHYIVLVADNSGTITVYDPYLYSGKFNTASRRSAGVTVSGNNVYVSESSFRTYANYKNFWIYSNDNGSGSGTATTVNYTRYVATQSANLRVRNNPNGSVVGSLTKGTAVTVYEVSGDWSRIGTNRWVSSAYLSASPVSGTTTTYATSSSGKYYRLKAKTTMYSRSNMTGTKYNYLAKTQIKVIKSVNSSVDYVYVVKTGRYAYCYKSAYSSSALSNSSKTGTYKRLKSKTYLYSKSNLTGTKYTYLAGTQVKVVKHISSNVDYVYVVKTGRYAYVKTNAYK